MAKALQIKLCCILFALVILWCVYNFTDVHLRQIYWLDTRLYKVPQFTLHEGQGSLCGHLWLNCVKTQIWAKVLKKTFFSALKCSQEHHGLQHCEREEDWNQQRRLLIELCNSVTGLEGSCLVMWPRTTRNSKAASEILSRDGITCTNTSDLLDVCNMAIWETLEGLECFSGLLDKNWLKAELQMLRLGGKQVLLIKWLLPSMWSVVMVTSCNADTFQRQGWRVFKERMRSAAKYKEVTCSRIYITFDWSAVSSFKLNNVPKHTAKTTLDLLWDKALNVLKYSC